MPLERESVSEGNLGSLRSCLVEGDAEQRKRERSVRRRALLISIVLQATAVTVLLLIPLFAKPPKIVQAYMPVPFYTHAASRPVHPEIERTHVTPQNVCRFCAPLRIPTTIATHVAAEPPADDGGEGLTGNQVPVLPGEIPLANPTNVRPPAPTPTRPHMLHFTHLDQALLIHRVEPIYPTLARQTGRSGKVELRAVIATDGSIQSLQVVSGDPIFYRSAMEAVQQWRYRPTVLNGQPVEIDTFITVIYNMQR